MFCSLTCSLTTLLRRRSICWNPQLDGWSKDRAALITTTPHIAYINVVQQYLNIFPQASKSSERCEYYLLYGNCVVRTRENALKFASKCIMYVLCISFKLQSHHPANMPQRGVRCRCNRLRCPMARMSGLQCFNIGHNGHGINLYGVSMTLMGN